MSSASSTSMQFPDFENFRCVHGGFGILMLPKDPSSTDDCYKFQPLFDTRLSPQLLAEMNAKFCHSSLVELHSTAILSTVQIPPSVLPKLNSAVEDWHKDGHITTKEYNYVAVMTFEFCSHGDLLHLYFGEGKQRPDYDQVRIITVEMLTALKHLQDNHYIHCDIKLENIFLSNINPKNSNSYKLGDFGSILRAVEGDVTPPAQNSSFYAPPEFSETKSAYYSSDLYSLGVVVALLIAGFEGQPLSNESHWNRNVFEEHIPEDCPSELVDFVHAVTQEQPLQRPSITSLLSLPWVINTADHGEIPGLQPQITAVPPAPPAESDASFDAPQPSSSSASSSSSAAPPRRTPFDFLVSTLRQGFLASPGVVAIQNGISAYCLPKEGTGEQKCHSHLILSKKITQPTGHYYFEMSINNNDISEMKSQPVHEPSLPRDDPATSKRGPNEILGSTPNLPVIQQNHPALGSVRHTSASTPYVPPQPEQETSLQSQCRFGVHIALSETVEPELDSPEYLGKNAYSIGYAMDGKIYYNNEMIFQGLPWKWGDMLGIEICPMHDSQPSLLLFYINGQVQNVQVEYPYPFLRVAAALDRPHLSCLMVSEAEDLNLAPLSSIPNPKRIYWQSTLSPCFYTENLVGVLFSSPNHVRWTIPGTLSVVLDRVFTTERLHFKFKVQFPSPPTYKENAPEPRFILSLTKSPYSQSRNHYPSNYAIGVGYSDVGYVYIGEKTDVACPFGDTRKLEQTFEVYLDMKERKCYIVPTIYPDYTSEITELTDNVMIHCTSSMEGVSCDIISVEPIEELPSNKLEYHFPFPKTAPKKGTKTA